MEGAFAQRRAFVGLGSILGSSAGGEIPRDIGQIIGVGGAFGAVGIAAGILAVGLHAVTENADKAAKAISDSAAAYGNVQEAALKLTKAQVEQQLAEATQVLQLRQRLADEANQQLVTATFNVSPIAALLGTDANYKGIKDSADAANQSLAEAQDNVAALTITLDGFALGADSAGDAAAALEKTTNDQIAHSKRVADAEGLTKEQRDERIRQLANEYLTLNQLSQNADLSDEALKSLQDEMAGVYDEYQILIHITSTFADQLKAEADFKQAVIDRSDASQRQLERPCQRRSRPGKGGAEVCRHPESRE